MFFLHIFVGIVFSFLFSFLWIRVGGIEGGYVVGIGGYIIGFILSAYLVDIFYYKNKSEGFFFRYRPIILRLIVQIATAILFTKLLVDNFWMFILGCYVGDMIASWLLRQMRWDEETAMSVVNQKANYLFTLYHFLRANGDMEKKVEDEFLEVFRGIFKEEGVGESAMYSNFQTLYKPVSHEELIGYLGGIPPQVMESFLFDYLRCSYASAQVSDSQLRLAEQICNYYNGNLNTVGLYHRYPVKSSLHQSLQSAYDELGLNPNATQEDINAAYREKMKAFHPDKLHGISGELAELAKKKAVAVNEAYEMLTHQGNSSSNEITERVLFFLAVDKDEPFLPPNGETFTCRCILCKSLNRIPSGQNAKVARCHLCHALLGHPENL